MTKLIEDLKKVIRNQIIPIYTGTGNIYGAYIKGSLFDGFTTESDLDVSIVWELDEIFLNRRKFFSDISLDEDPLIVDYRDVHMDRFVLNGQEFNIGHMIKGKFESMISNILKGEGFNSEDIINPLISVSSFFYGELLLDKSNGLDELKNDLRNFPQKLIQNVDSYWSRKKNKYSQKLQLFLERGDIISFSRISVQALELALLVIYTKKEIYFPGYKWTKQNFQKHKIDTDIVTIFEEMLVANNLQCRYNAWDRIRKTLDEH